MKKILIIHGPNINKVGSREVIYYGEKTIQQVNSEIIKFSNEHRVHIEIFQSNSEGEIIDKIQKSINNVDGIVINPGAYTHYSYAIRDAIEDSNLPTIEVHMSNIYNREKFRRKSVIAPMCKGQISGFGINSYLLAIKALICE